VLRTRPGLAPPRICLPSTLLGYGAYLYACAAEASYAKAYRPALLPPASFRRTLLLHLCLWLPFASVPASGIYDEAGSGLCLMFVSYYQTSPYSSRAMPGTQPFVSLGRRVILSSFETPHECEALCCYAN